MTNSSLPMGPPVHYDDDDDDRHLEELYGVLARKDDEIKALRAALERARKAIGPLAWKKPTQKQYDALCAVFAEINACLGAPHDQR